MEKCKVIGHINIQPSSPVVLKRKYVQRPLKVRLAPLLAKALKSKGL